MIKFQLLLIWSIALLSVGTIAGWKSHEKITQVQQNPWSIVQLIGASHD